MIVGITSHATWQPTTDKQALKDPVDAAKVGAGIVRYDVGYSSFQERSAAELVAWRIARLDALVKATVRAGMKVQLTVTESACWASSAPDEMRQGCVGEWWNRGPIHLYPPSNPYDYARFVLRLAQRYGTDLHAVEVQNEWNSPDFVTGPDAVTMEDRAHQLARLTIATSHLLRKSMIQPPLVVAGAVQECDDEFVDEFAPQVDGWCDAFSIHPYAHDQPATRLRPPEYRQQSVIQGVPRIMTTLARHGLDVPLWVTEFGWPTSDLRGPDPSKNGVDPADQAAYVGDALEMFGSWGVDVAIMYSLRDVGTDRTERVPNFGAFDIYRKEKPVGAALRAAAAKWKGTL